MTDNIATVEDLDAATFLRLLESLGYRPQHSEYDHAVGFSSEGELVNLALQDVPDFLTEGTGVVVWLGESESLYLSVALAKPRVYLTGLSSAAEAAFCNSLSKMGVKFTVAHEDFPLEA